MIDGLRRDKNPAANANIQRNVSLRERVQLQLRLDAANVLNRTHYQAPNVDQTSTQFWNHHERQHHGDPFRHGDSKASILIHFVFWRANSFLEHL